MNGNKLTVEQYENKLRTDINTRRLSDETIQDMITKYKEKLRVEKEAEQLAVEEQEENQGGEVVEVPPGHDIDPNSEKRILKKMR